MTGLNDPEVREAGARALWSTVGLTTKPWDLMSGEMKDWFRERWDRIAAEVGPHLGDEVAANRARLERLVSRLETEHVYGFDELLDWWDEEVRYGREQTARDELASVQRCPNPAAHVEVRPRPSRVVYWVGGACVIAENDVWIPGRFATSEAAEFAFGIDNVKLQGLQDEVNARESDYDKRVITLEMLRELTP